MWPGQLVLALIGLTAGKLQSKKKKKKIRREATVTIILSALIKWTYLEYCTNVHCHIFLTLPILQGVN